MGTKGITANGLSGTGLGPTMGGKMHGGGVKLDRKSIGKLTQSEDDVFSGKETQMENDSMAKAGVVSGSHSGKFMATPRYKSHGTSKAKPDFPDVDGDGNTTESIKSASASITKYGGDKKKVKKVNEMSNRRRKDTYSYQEPKAKVLKK